LMALQSALYKATITALERDKFGVFTHWQAYALIIASFLGLYLVQNAYQAGPLAASMPVMDAVLPTVAIALGIGLCGEPINTRWPRPAPLMLSVALAVLAALGNAAASVLQRKADREEPEGQATGLALLWHLVHRPPWLGGIAAMIVAFLLQAAALATGAIALV